MQNAQNETATLKLLADFPNSYPSPLPTFAGNVRTSHPFAVELQGNQLFIADSGNYRIRVVNLGTGIIQPYAGQGVAGSEGDGGPAASARFRLIAFLALDAQGNLLISDQEDRRVRRIDRQTRLISTFAGFDRSSGSFDLSLPRLAPVSSPEGLAVDTSTGAVYIADQRFGNVVRVDPSGTFRNFAGPADIFDDPLVKVNLPGLAGLAIDNARRTLYISAYRGCTVSSVNLDTGIVGTVAGDPRQVFCGFGGDGGSALGSRRLAGPIGVAVNRTGGVAISDEDANRIRQVNPAGIINTIAGRQPFGGDGGAARDATFFEPRMAISDGAGGYFVADTANCVIRRIGASGTVSTYAGRPGICRSFFDMGGMPADQAWFDHPVALARNRRGDLYVSDASGVTRIDGIDRRAWRLSLSSAGGLALDPTGENLYIADTRFHRIIRVYGPNNVTSVFAGGAAGFAGDDGLASEARFRSPTDVAVDRAGNVYVADSGNHRIRRIEADTLRVSTVAGNGTIDAVDSGPATGAGLPSPTTIAVDADGVLYTTSGHRVLRITQTPGGGGSMRVIAGSNQRGFMGDGALGLNARFNGPASVRAGSGGGLIVADTFNHRIRTLTPAPPVELVPVSGNNQSAPVNTSTADPLVVQVRRLADGTPEPGVAVTFVASAGRLEPPTPVLTGADGTASVRLTMPPEMGSVTVTATADSLAPVTFTATTIAAPAAARPGDD